MTVQKERLTTAGQNLERGITEVDDAYLSRGDTICQTNSSRFFRGVFRAPLKRAGEKKKEEKKRRFSPHSKGALECGENRRFVSSCQTGLPCRRANVGESLALSCAGMPASLRATSEADVKPPHDRTRWESRPTANDAAVRAPVIKRRKREKMGLTDMLMRDFACQVVSLRVGAGRDVPARVRSGLLESGGASGGAM